jgi:hypothetical protein
MTEQSKATELVDNALREISGRDLVSAKEMTDLLLDIRLYLMSEGEKASTTLTE